MNEIDPKKSLSPVEEGRVDDVFQSVIEQAPPYLAEILKASATLAGDMLAASVPHLATLILTYRQKRAERNMARLFLALQEQSATIEKRLSELESSLRDEVRDRVFPALLDFVFEEREEAKVPMFVAGFVVALKIHREPGPSVLFMQYAEFLAQLSEVEFHVLADMAPRLGGGAFREDMIPGRDGYLKRLGLTQPSFDLIQEKLHRLGLIEDENDEKLLEQVELHDKIIDQLLSKQVSISRTTNNIGFYRKPYSESYWITETGQGLLAFCETQSNLQ